MSLNSNRQLTDSQLGLSLNNNIQDVDDNGDGGLRDFDIVERTRHELSLAYNGTQTSVVYNFTRDHQDYQTLNQDESTQTTSVTLRYRQSASASWSFRMARTTSTFQVPGAADTRFRQYNRRLTWDVKLNTDLSTQTWIGFDRRRSDAGTTSYKDETIGVRLTYRI